MPTALHSNLANEKWLTKTLAEQLGNIGSEYERALHWRQKNRPALFESAAERMLELFDLTLADTRWHNHRLKELARAREVACSELFEGGELVKNPETLKKYFFQFAALARANH